MQVKFPVVSGNCDRHTDRQTDWPTNRQTDRLDHMKVSLPIIGRDMRMIWLEAFEDGIDHSDSMYFFLLSLFLPPHPLLLLLPFELIYQQHASRLMIYQFPYSIKSAFYYSPRCATMCQNNINPNHLNSAPDWFNSTRAQCRYRYRDRW